MSDADLERKFRALTEGIIDEAHSNRLLELCWSLPELPDAGAVARAAAVP